MRSARSTSRRTRRARVTAKTRGGVASSGAGAATAVKARLRCRGEWQVILRGGDRLAAVDRLLSPRKQKPLSSRAGLVATGQRLDQPIQILLSLPEGVHQHALVAPMDAIVSDIAGESGVPVGRNA